MAIETTPEATQAVTPDETPAQAATTTPEVQAADGSESISIEEARKLRRENQSLRKRQKELDEAKAAEEAAKLSDTERLQKEHAELRAKYDSDITQKQTLIIHYEIEKQAVKVGIRPEAAEDVIKLIDWSELEYDEETGRPTNADKLLAKLVKAKPYLATPQQQATKPQTQISAMNPERQVPGTFPPGYRPKLSDVFQ